VSSVFSVVKILLHCRRRILAFPPRLCQFGGSSRASRRFLWRKIRNTVAVPVLPAMQFGDNVAYRSNKKGDQIASQKAC